MYEKGAQYNSFKELEDNIYTGWNNIDPENLKEIVASMLDNMAQCLTIKKEPKNY